MAQQLPFIRETLSREMVAAMLPEAMRLYDPLAVTSGDVKNRVTDPSFGTERPRVVAVAGRMGVGKDHACDLLVDRYGFMKIHVFEMGYERIANFHGRPVRKPEDRATLQALGELGRCIDPLFWLKDILSTRIMGALATGVAGVAITGVRYKTDVEYLKGLGIDTIIIRRPQLLRGEPCEMALSERDLDDYTGGIVIENTGTVQEYDIMLERMVHERLPWIPKN
ncbi:ORF76 [black bullhead herpesvirus]|uniref:ORF76 n=1 Tax=black bullhead herpesvirus TaxID=508441 RepID=A0A2H5AJK3_9VIRU|nr:ORF76 [black bullhead herpesvirus]AUG72322.1 ORF76 [black bullhead herpesvirus]